MTADTGRRRPTTSRAGDGPDRGVTGSSPRRTGSSSRRALGSSGARSRSPAGSDETGCRSATRSTAMCGRTAGEARCTAPAPIAQAAAEAIRQLRQPWHWRASGRSLSGPREPRTGAESGTSDTVIGSSDKHCVLTLVDRKTGYTMIGKLESRTVKAVNRRAIGLFRGSRRRVRTTVDNGTEFRSDHRHEVLLRRSDPGSGGPARTPTA